MQSMTYVLVAYAVGLLLIGGFSFYVVWQRRSLRMLLASLEVSE